jgi:methionine aminopeptidase
MLIKSKAELNGLKRIGRIVRTALDEMATAVRSLSAHYEHTIVITKEKPILLTAA